MNLNMIALHIQNQLFDTAWRIFFNSLPDVGVLFGIRQASIQHNYLHFHHPVGIVPA